MKSILVLVVAAGFAVSGCATKKYVAREVGAVNTKVENLNTELEKTQERVRNSEVAIDKVNTDAQSGIGEAKSAAGEAKATADGAMTKASDAEKAAKGKLIYSVTLANDKVQFPFNRAALSPEAQAMIDEAIANVKSENKGIYIEIEGHTDSVGPEAYNQKLGEERADAAAQLPPRQARHRPRPHERHLLRRRQARDRQQELLEPRCQPPRGHQLPRVVFL